MELKLKNGLLFPPCLNDAINRRFGRDTVGLAAGSWRPDPQWGMRQEHLSRRYTTSIDDLPCAIC
ncbi:MAG: DUF4113 domain-containing protein [Candidatus Accumulibacter sp.]|jgi:DNA polymerase V|nr:DUF4113 domain-containing protein [Accumulibacter sp.]